MRQKNKLSFQLLCALVLSISGGTAFAEVTVTAELTGGATDNISRTDDNEDKAGIASVGVKFEFDEKTRAMEASGLGSLYYVDYFQTDQYDDDTLGFLDAIAVFTLKDNMLTWMVQDNYGQQTIDPYEAATPGNRENINYFTTGPDLQLPLWDRTALIAGAKLSTVSYETTPLDNQRLGANLGILRNLSASQGLSLNANAETIEYDSPLYADFDKSELYLRFETKAARTDADISVGWNKIETDTESADGLFLALSATRQLSAYSVLSASVGSRYSDAGDIFRFYQEEGQLPGDIENVDAQANPFQNNYATLGLNSKMSRTTLMVNLLYSDEDYEVDDTSDRTRTDLDIAVIRQMRSNLDLTIGASWEQYKYDVGGLGIDDWSLYGELVWRYSRTFSVSCRYGHYDRSGDGVSNFTENKLFLTVGYSPEL